MKKDGDQLIRSTNEIVDKVQIDLQSVVQGKGHDLDTKVKADYKKRKLIKEMWVLCFLFYNTNKN